MILATCPVDSERTADSSTWGYHLWLAIARREESQHRPAEAAAAYHAALRQDPVGFDALSGLARIFARMMDHDAAVEWSRRALEAHADDVEGRLQLASHLLAARLLEEASGILANLPEDYARVCEARGNCLVLQGRLKQGMHWLRRAVALAPDSCQMRTSLAIGHWRCHRRDAARRELGAARELDPGNMHTRFVLMHLLLEQGDFIRGYSDPEAFDAIYPPAIHGRRWRGESIEGKCLLLYDQHGHGDTLQMVRYAELCAERGARVLLKVRQSMVPLLQSLRGVDRIVAMTDANPVFDYQARLLDLPAIFSHTQATLPRRVPYLAADAARVRRMQEYLQGLPRPWIGIAWRGNPRQKDGLIRSCEVADLQPLTRIGGSLVNLQLDASAGELEALGAHAVPDMDRDGAFLDSAALIDCLDATITVDTSIAHLAGALGAPVFLLLPFWSDWRWMANRSDSPWYPSMRLFRQTRPHDWAPPVAAVVQTVKTFCY